MIGHRNATACVAAKLSIAAIVAFIATFGVFALGRRSPVSCRRSEGPVRGVTTEATNQYLGIPYAAPPVGDLRWRPPRPGRALGTARATSTSFAPSLRLKRNPRSASAFDVPEDCLYLNVFTPNTGKKGKGSRTRTCPVMVWLHGGALVVGESDDYDPGATRLAGTLSS